MPHFTDFLFAGYLEMRLIVIGMMHIAYLKQGVKE